jgi:hypothetical protein
MPKSPPTLAQLQAAAKDLLFPSESDAPVEAFAWPAADTAEAALRANAAVTDGAPVETVTVAQLKKTIPSESRAEFKPLFDLLAALKGTTVFKVGEVNVAVYVVGKAADGSFLGVKTEVVET